MGNRAVDLEALGYNVVFAFEEAIGFMVGNCVHDKDGISSLLVLAENASRIYEENGTLYKLLQHIYEV